MTCKSEVINYFQMPMVFTRKNKQQIITYVSFRGSSKRISLKKKPDPTKFVCISRYGPSVVAISPFSKVLTPLFLRRVDFFCPPASNIRQPISPIFPS